MKTVIFQTKNAAFKFDRKEVTEYLIASESEYNPDKVSQLLKLISSDCDETIFNSDDHHYFGFTLFFGWLNRCGDGILNL